MGNRNAELIAAVFVELKAARPEGLRYLSLRLKDDSFVHIVENAVGRCHGHAIETSTIAAVRR